MGNIIDQEDNGLEERIAARRHKELLKAIGSIKLEPKDDSELKSLIHSAQMNNELFIRKIGELQKQELPKNEINVQTDHSEITQTLKNIADQITQSNEKVVGKLDEWINESKREKSFNMKMNRPNGFISSVNGIIK